MPRKPRRSYPNAVTLYLSDAQKNQLVQRAAQVGVDQCELMRQALDAFVTSTTSATAALNATAQHLTAIGRARRGLAPSSPPGSVARTGEVVRPLRFWRPLAAS